jgi:hypothetical protein
MLVAPSRNGQATDIVCGIDRGEGALETVHCLSTSIGLAEVSAQQVVISIFNGCQLVVL